MANKYTSCATGNCSTAFTINTNASEFLLRQGDTCPEFKISLTDKEGNMVSHEDWTVEVYMFFNSSLKSLTPPESGNYDILTLLGNENISQVKIGDIISVDDCNQNNEELMIVRDVNFDTYEISVERGYNSSDIYDHKKRDKLIFYRIYGKSGYITNKTEPVDGEDFTDDFSIAAYHWCISDTSHKGLYYLQLKLSMAIDTYYVDPDCGSWIKTYPASAPGYAIRIN